MSTNENGYRTIPLKNAAMAKLRMWVFCASGVLKTIDGREFMDDCHPLKSLAPRDVVARAIDGEMKKSGAERAIPALSVTTTCVPPSEVGSGSVAAD